LPDDVQDHGLELGIAVVAVGFPAACDQIQFNVAADGRLISELNDRRAKVGSALATEETGVKDSHGLSVERAQLVAAQALVLPDGLQELFGGWLSAFAECGHSPTLTTPAGVEVVEGERHSNCFCAGTAAKSSQRWWVKFERNHPAH